ncbi:tyrosine-type recombinase/integrase [Thalassoglobus sp.]|uniref:tyrosine-type recombinase/integrase n=1 Tax=Thalassoglobus sp. TaxID=2795869 RepID=UPI003AA8A92E
MSSSLPKKRIPKYRHYKPKNLGVVRLDGRDYYLGEYNSPESWEKYHRLIAEWLGGGSLSSPALEPIGDSSASAAVNHILLAYWKYAETYYVRDGETTKELEGMRDALRPVRKLYGHTPAADFGPKALKAVRDHMIDVQDLCRTEINKRIGRIKRAFKWAVSEELIPPSISHGLSTVKGLMKGRSRARESERVKPVPDAHVDAVLPYLPPQIVGMIELQRLTGMRPGEVVLLRPCDLDKSLGEVWIYRPQRHKNMWRDHVRAIALGPRCQEILAPFLARADEDYCFSPQEAQQWRMEHRQTHQKKERQTPIYPSELKAREKAKQARRKRKPKRPKGAHYTTHSFWKALQYGFVKAEKAGVELVRWHPHQLRHSRGTDLRRKYGIEASRVSLGHARLEATEIYAEQNLQLAIEIAKEAG